MTIILGPAGAGGDTLKALDRYYKLGIKAMEVEFVYGVKMSNSLAKKIGEKAKQLNIKLSVHAPYFINLNSAEKAKIIASKKRILQSAERAHYLGAEKVVFHPGYYGKIDKETTYQNIKKQIIDLQKTIKQKAWKVKLAPETTGKINVFGSVDEILRLVKETKCSFCIDFAHIYARNQGKINYKQILKKFKDPIHAHFSGIEFGPKGEKRHILTPIKELKKLLKAVKHRNITIINESPNPVNDTLKSMKILKSNS